MRSDTIIGYTFAADTYCPACIIDVLPTGPGETYDGWALADGAYMSAEDNLAELAGAFGVDRMDERAFDSGDFPKVIFADQFESEVCGRCGEYLLENTGGGDEDDSGVGLPLAGQAALFDEERDVF